MSEATAPVVPLVYKSIQNAAEHIAKEGVGKSRENTFHKYKFRSIEDVMNAVAPALAVSNLIVTPRYKINKAEMGLTKKQEAQHHVVLEACYDFICTLDGSKHTVCTVGEAMDTSDKASNKAMAAAYKYAMTQAFNIPYEGMDDGDATSPEAPMPRQQQAPQQQQKPAQAPQQQQQQKQPAAAGSDEEKKVLRNEMDKVCDKHFLNPMAYKVGEQVQPWRDFMDSEVGAWINKLPRKDLQEMARRYFKFKFYGCRLTVLGPDAAGIALLQDEVSGDHDLNEQQKAALHKSMETAKEIPW